MHYKYFQCLFLWIVLLQIEYAFSDANIGNDGNIKEKKIFGGMDTKYAEFPWQIAMWRKNATSQIYKLSCGGALINRKWVITAAHCIIRFDANDIFVTIGKTNLNVIEPNERKIDVYKRIVHPEYNTYTILNDIGLLKLRETLEYGENIVPIPLSLPGANYENSICISSGWGADDLNQMLPGARVNPNLQRISLEIMSEEKCPRGPEFICAGGLPEGGKGVCYGDSGGPLQCIVDGEYVLIGIVSHGIPCATPGLPDYFTNISHYYNWILDTITVNS